MRTDISSRKTGLRKTGSTNLIDEDFARLAPHTIKKRLHDSLVIKNPIDRVRSSALGLRMGDLRVRDYLERDDSTLALTILVSISPSLIGKLIKESYRPPIAFCLFFFSGRFDDNYQYKTLATTSKKIARNHFSS